SALHNLSVASMHQLFVTGFFHADPHPGNILVLRDSSVAFVDFGIFGELSVRERDLLATYIENLAIGNINTAFRYFSQLLTPTPATDLREFQHDLKDVLRRWYEAARDLSLPAKERHTGKYSTETIELIRKHRVIMSMETLLFWRALIALDSSALRFPEHFDLVAELRSFFTEMRPGPVPRVVDVLRDEDRAAALMWLSRDIPRSVARGLRATTHGEAALVVSANDDGSRRRSRDRVALSASAAAASVGAATWLGAAGATAATWLIALTVAALAIGSLRALASPR
ncbi:MAG TPA: AarF/UbiB family protein, partial [Candidatus Sulfotelmatobacter sp.]|nr:AarF/UbiB family protein [Candidatus Sulfotelmatobacter sp.]